MMSNNKILTVSYGTFSCTLEGFDDSFGTMKAIAEYFRDLAADDRYFGAEPPQPDAEMLARIAQKEISRRVQAREHDGKIVLSALEDYRSPPQTPVAKAPASPETGAASAASATPVAGIAAVADAVSDDNKQAEQETPAAATAPGEAETVTASNKPVDEDDAAIAAEAHVDVEDLADSTAPTDTADAPVESRAEETGFIADTAVVDQPEAVAVEEDENDIVPGQPDSDVEAFFADNASASDDFEDEAEDDAQPEMAETDAFPITQSAPVSAAPAADSIAAKLQRIRAVVAQHDETADEDDYAEDEHAIATARGTTAADHDDAEDFADDDFARDDTRQDAVARARHDIEDALDADDAVDQGEEDDNYSDILNRLAMDDEPGATPQKAETADSDDTTESEDALSNLFDEEDDAEAEPTAEYEDTAEAEDDDEADDDFDIAAKADEESEASAGAAEPSAPQPRARVIKVKRADLEAAIERGELEEYDDDDDFDMSADEDEDMKLDDLAPAKSDSTSLSPEDERELARELAELEKDIEGDSTSPERAAAEDHSAATSRHALPAIEDETSGDMTRLMAEADHQMDEPESTTRRNAFAHLRAAVAAKKADNAIGTDVEQEKKDRAFRSDLAEVVRPRRPVGSGSRTARPEESRPAPLKLVAEQRIDVAKPASAGPVRPRRVSAVAAVEPKAPAEGMETFAEFAADMGAHSLPELLEAAAAYLSFVEGLEQFSRPQLMTKVRQVGPEEGFSREDGLRSFGQLLRAGKIEKIKGGRFTVSDDIGYRPDQRAVG